MLKKCKNFFIFFEKTIDKHNKLCYNKDNEREVNTMKQNETNYINTQTGELTTNQKEAMEWYREGIEVEVWTWSETLQEMVNRVTWVH